jgi:site-specific recombinase XerC
MEDIDEILFRYLSQKTKQVSPNYIRDHAIVLKSIIRDLRGLGVSALTCDRSTLELWISKKSATVRQSTVGAYLFAFELFLAWCQRNGLIKVNIAKAFELPKFRRPFRKVFGSARMVKILIEECEDPALKFILYAGFHAGLRKNEIVNAKPSWFNLELGVLNVLRCDCLGKKPNSAFKCNISNIH